MGFIPKPLEEANLIGPSKGEELIGPGMYERLVEMINLTDTFIAFARWFGYNGGNFYIVILGELEYTPETD